MRVEGGGVDFIFGGRDNSDEAHVSDAVDFENGVDWLVVATVSNEEDQGGVFAAVRDEHVFGGWRELHRGETVRRANAARGEDFAKVTLL